MSVCKATVGSALLDACKVLRSPKGHGMMGVGTLRCPPLVGSPAHRPCIHAPPPPRGPRRTSPLQVLVCDAGGGLAVWTPEANVKARPVGAQQQQQQHHTLAGAGTAAPAAGGGAGPAATAAASRPLVPGRITCVCAASGLGPATAEPARAASPGAQSAQSPSGGGGGGQAEGVGPAAAAAASSGTAEAEARRDTRSSDVVAAKQQLAVVGTADGRLHVVDVAAGELVAAVQAHRGAVRSLQLVGLPYLSTAVGGPAAAASDALSAAASAAATAHAAPGEDLWLVSSGEDELAKVGWQGVAGCKGAMGCRLAPGSKCWPGCGCLVLLGAK